MSKYDLFLENDGINEDEIVRIFNGQLPEIENDKTLRIQASYQYNVLKNKEIAIDFYLRSIELGNIRALGGLAHIYMKNNKIDEAIALYLRAINLNDFNSMCNLALYYMKINKGEEAIELWLRAIDFNHSNSMFNLARYYMKNNKEFEAVNLYMKLIELKNIDAMIILGNYYFRWKNRTDAIKLYLKATECGNLNCISKLRDICTGYELYELLKSSEINKIIIDELNRLIKCNDVKNILIMKIDKRVNIGRKTPNFKFVVNDEYEFPIDSIYLEEFHYFAILLSGKFQEVNKVNIYVQNLKSIDFLMNYLYTGIISNLLTEETIIFEDLKNICDEFCLDDLSKRIDLILELKYGF